MNQRTKSELAHYRRVISDNVRKIRGGLTREEFAGKAGLSASTVHRIESCKNFQADSLLRIAVAFGIFPYELCLTDEERKRLHLRTDVLVESFKEVIKNEIIAELKKG
jgi:transcriptional regulator with XRE-family HTH domain